MRRGFLILFVLVSFLASHSFSSIFQSNHRRELFNELLSKIHRRSPSDTTNLDHERRGTGPVLLARLTNKISGRIPLGSMTGWHNSAGCFTTDPLLCFAHNSTHLCYAWSEPAPNLLFGDASKLTTGDPGRWSSQLTSTSISYTSKIGDQIELSTYNTQSNRWSTPKGTPYSSWSRYNGFNAYEACQPLGSPRAISVIQVDWEGVFQFPMKPYYYIYDYSSGATNSPQMKADPIPSPISRKWNPTTEGLVFDGLTTEWPTKAANGIFLQEPLFGVAHDSKKICFGYRNPIGFIYMTTANAKKGFSGIFNLSSPQYFSVAANKMSMSTSDSFRLKTYQGKGLDNSWDTGVEGDPSDGQTDKYGVDHSEFCYPLSALGEGWAPMKIQIGDWDHQIHYPPRPFYFLYGPQPSAASSTSAVPSSPPTYPTIAPTPAISDPNLYGAVPYPTGCNYWNENDFDKYVKDPNRWQCARYMFLTYVKFPFTPADKFNFKKEEADYFSDKRYSPSVFGWARTLFLKRPLDCLIVNSSNEWCDVTKYWRPYDGRSSIPVCRSSFCWFNPGKECLARVWRYDSLRNYQIALLSNLPSLKSHLASFSTLIGLVVTKCFDPKQLVGRKCPLNDCTSMKRSGGQLWKRLINKRATCPMYDCSNCERSDSNNQNCVGTNPMTWSPLCCSCTLDYDITSYFI